MNGGARSPFTVTRTILAPALRADFVVRVRFCARSQYFMANGGRIST